MTQRPLFRVRLHWVAVSQPKPKPRYVEVLAKARQELERPVDEAERRQWEADYLAVRAGELQQ